MAVAGGACWVCRKDAPGCRQKVTRKFAGARKLCWAVRRAWAYHAMGPAYPPFCKGRSGAGYELAWDGAAGSLMGTAASKSRGDIICQKFIFLGNRDSPVMMMGWSHASTSLPGSRGFPECRCFHLVFASCDC